VQVTAISPATGSALGGDSVTITGSGFTGVTAVDFGNASAPQETVISDTQITATTPPGNGTVDVIVVTPTGTSSLSPADQFSYQDAQPS
jgi:IPT/TIG domain